MSVRAVVVDQHGGPDVLRVRDWPEPTPGHGDLVVDVAAAGVNFIDIYKRSGAYPTETPFVSGAEGAGTVAAVGDGVSEFAVGDRVAWAMVDGTGYTQQAVVPAARAVAVPDGLDLELAGAVMLQGMTAHYLCRSLYQVRAGDDVLVHAGAGGMGLLLTQLITQLGARVIATTSTPQKAELARGAGAAEVILYAEADVAAEVRRLTDGTGVQVVYDGVGAATFEASLDSLAVRGMMALYGAASGPVPPFDPQRLNAKGSLFLTRPTLAHYIRTREELEWRAGEVLSMVADGRLDVRVGGRYPLDRAAQAHEDLAGRRSTGKLLVLPQQA